MKASLLLATLAVSLAAAVSAQAQTPAPAPDAPPPPAAAKQGDFASHKAAILAHMDQRMSAMTTARACVAAAAAPADLKACRQQGHGPKHGKRAPA